MERYTAIGTRVETWATDNQGGIQYYGEMFFVVNGQTLDYSYGWVYPSVEYWIN